VVEVYEKYFTLLTNHIFMLQVCFDNKKMTHTQLCDVNISCLLLIGDLSLMGRHYLKPCFKICFGMKLITFLFAEDLDGGEYLFAFRMLMVLSRREFSFADTLYLWEVRTNSHDKTNFITFD
jgi:hypothetical protein